jgi:hypothetical protein
MPSQAQKAYYEKHKEALKERMRQRDAERRDALRQHLAENPEDIVKVRQKMRDKYHTNVANKIRKAMEVVIADPTTDDFLRAFFRGTIDNDKYHTLTPKIVEQLCAAYASPAMEDFSSIISEADAEQRNQCVE